LHRWISGTFVTGQTGQTDSINYCTQSTTITNGTRSDMWGKDSPSAILHFPLTGVPSALNENSMSGVGIAGIGATGPEKCHKHRPDSGAYVQGGSRRQCLCLIDGNEPRVRGEQHPPRGYSLELNTCDHAAILLPFEPLSPAPANEQIERPLWSIPSAPCREVPVGSECVCGTRFTGGISGSSVQAKEIHGRPPA
jgi:hypothetical protein